jgi:23S rRNA (uridine2552-2'-O)-methyltransferase
MNPIPALLIEGDFREQAVLASVMQSLGGEKADLVVSDMAPNLSGVDASDQAGRCIYANSADFARGT